jgi:hypothetical protein
MKVTKLFLPFYSLARFCWLFFIFVFCFVVWLLFGGGVVWWWCCCSFLRFVPQHYLFFWRALSFDREDDALVGPWSEYLWSIVKQSTKINLWSIWYSITELQKSTINRQPTGG